jgi:hypothetical protein
MMLLKSSFNMIQMAQVDSWHGPLINLPAEYRPLISEIPNENNATPHKLAIESLVGELADQADGSDLYLPDAKRHFGDAAMILERSNRPVDLVHRAWKFLIAMIAADAARGQSASPESPYAPDRSLLFDSAPDVTESHREGIT